jgi:hypothetical protein
VPLNHPSLYWVYLKARPSAFFFFFVCFSYICGARASQTLQRLASLEKEEKAELCRTMASLLGDVVEGVRAHLVLGHKNASVARIHSQIVSNVRLRAISRSGCCVCFGVG